MNRGPLMPILSVFCFLPPTIALPTFVHSARQLYQQQQEHPGSPHDLRLAAYVDHEGCGKGRPQQNHEWCVAKARGGYRNKTLCRRWVFVSEEICKSQKASLVHVRGNGRRWNFTYHNCEYAFWAQYRCDNPTNSEEDLFQELDDFNNTLLVPGNHSAQISWPMEKWLAGADEEPFHNVGVIGPRWVDDTDPVPRPDNWPTKPPSIIAPSYLEPPGFPENILEKESPTFLDEPTSIHAYLPNTHQPHSQSPGMPVVSELLRHLRANSAMKKLVTSSSGS